MRKFLLLWFFLPAIACKKDKSSPIKSFPEIRSGEMLLVCSEGNFRWNNAEAGLLNLRSGESEWNAFSVKNQRPLGDVLQSAAFWDGKLWLLVNNSGRMEGLNPATFALTTSISGLVSPRFLQAVSDEKAFVSDLYASRIWIVRRGSDKPSGSISMPGWTEEMIFSGGKVWVLCRERNFLLGIDPENDVVSDTLFLPGKGTSLAEGKDGKIWAAFEQNPAPAAGLVLLHPDSSQILFRWNTMPNAPAPDRLNSMGDTLYFLQDGLFRLHASHPEIHRIQLPQGNWYGLGLDRQRRELWLSDVKDYQQQSRVIRMDATGRVIQEITGGIISSRFLFW